MKKKEYKYFDDWKCQNISEQIAKKPYDTIEELERYIYEYPEDFKGKNLYAYNLVKLGRLEEAWKILKEVEESSRSTHFMTLSKKTRLRSEYYMIMTRLKILLYQEKYEEFLDYWDAYNDIIFSENPKEIVRAYHYVKEQLGKPSLEERENTSYLYRQITSYDEERFIEHVKNPGYNDEEKHCRFYPEFPVEKAVEEVKKYIMNPEVDRIFSSFIEDLYVFKYDSCGTDLEGKRLDYFSVITFHNTDKFISMRPFPFGPGYKSIDLNHLKDDDQPKSKRKSQIDKFNERYKNY